MRWNDIFRIVERRYGSGRLEFVAQKNDNPIEERNRYLVEVHTGMWRDIRCFTYLKDAEKWVDELWEGEVVEEVVVKT